MKRVTVAGSFAAMSALGALNIPVQHVPMLDASRMRLPSSWFDLSGRTAVVTGARSGIGKAVAIGLATAGADIVLDAGRGDVDQTENEVPALGQHMATVRADPSRVDDLTAALTDVFTDHDVDILVNNAGAVCRKPATEQSWQDWETVRTVNLDATWALCQFASWRMISRGHGKIINVASIRAFTGGVRGPAYTASKHAIVGLTKTLAAEWAGHGIQVNTIAPGYTETEMTEAHHSDPATSQAIVSRIPAGRWGWPDDYAAPAVFVASAASDYVNGHTVVPDGGYLSG